MTRLSEPDSWVCWRKITVSDAEPIQDLDGIFFIPESALIQYKFPRKTMEWWECSVYGKFVGEIDSPSRAKMKFCMPIEGVFPDDRPEWLRGAVVKYAPEGWPR